MKDFLRKILIGIISGIVGIFASPLFSDFLAAHIPYYDKIPPTIERIIPSSNEVIYNQENISIKIVDKGIGTDFESSRVIILGKINGEINGSVTNNGTYLIFAPSNQLKPDIYTIEIFPKDKAGNTISTPYSSIFYLSKKPNLDFWVKKSEFNYNPGDQVGNLIWKNNYNLYLLLLNNKYDSVQSLNDLNINLNFPYPVIGWVFSNLQNSNSCVIKYPEGRELIVDGKQVTVPSCDLILECNNLPPSGTFGGEIFVDSNYTGPKFMCNNLSDYMGSYFWNEFGSLRKEGISSKIS